MQQQQDFPKLVLTLQRPINCLTDQDRNTRSTGLKTICNQLSKIEPSNILRLFTQTNLQQYITKRTLSDKIQSNRELTLKIINTFCNKVKPQLVKNQHLQPFIQELIKRINSTPFAQTTEQLRLDIIKLLEKMVKTYPEAFHWFIPEISIAMSKTLNDGYPDVKHATNNLLNLLCDNYKDTIGNHCLNVVKALAQNLTHQHAKVRKGTLLTAGKVLITHNAGQFFEHIQVMIKASLNDKSADVRKQAISCSARLLKGFGPKYMKMYEPSLVGYLLSALSDENEQNVRQAIKQLQECGEAIKEMEGVDREMDVQGSSN